MPIIDVHTHVIPRLFLEEVASRRLFDIRLEGDELIHPDGDRYPVGREFYEPAVRLAEMDRLGIDISVLSVSPTLFLYSAPADEAVDLARRLNDALASWVAESSDRFAAMATLPLQSPVLAAAELERAVTTNGLVGAAIGTSLPNQVPIDAGDLEPVFSVANELKVPLLLHPNDPSVPMLDAFHLPNSIGNPLDTTIAATRLIFSGMLDRYSELRIVLVHAGGFLPYQFGRLDRAFHVRPTARVSISDPPSSYLPRFWIDSITHSRPALEYLVGLVGTSRVVLGSDFPFDMQDADPVGLVRSARVDPFQLGATAQELFRLGTAPESRET